METILISRRGATGGWPVRSCRASIWRRRPPMAVLSRRGRLRSKPYQQADGNRQHRGSELPFLQIQGVDLNPLRRLV